MLTGAGCEVVLLPAGVARGATGVEEFNPRWSVWERFDEHNPKE
jgi:hypothetical protein